MSNDAQHEVDFASVKARLAEIADTVDDESLSLDDALDLYEEAVALGLKASDLLEVGIDVQDENLDELSDGAADSASQLQPEASADASAQQA